MATLRVYDFHDFRSRDSLGSEEKKVLAELLPVAVFQAASPAVWAACLVWLIIAAIIFRVRSAYTRLQQGLPLTLKGRWLARNDAAPRMRSYLLLLVDIALWLRLLKWPRYHPGCGRRHSH